MITEHLDIILILAAQTLTLTALWHTHKDRDAWRAAWTRDAAELLHWKRNAILRDPKSGKYVKKDRKP
jgi:hypothetical protein